MRNRVQTAIAPSFGCCSPVTEAAEPAFDEAREDELAELFRALGHPARVRIVRYLLEKNTCIAGELADVLPLAASTVSQHLKILKDAGLIRGEVDGPRRSYCVNRRRVEEFLAGAAWLVAPLPEDFVGEPECC